MGRGGPALWPRPFYTPHSPPTRLWLRVAEMREGGVGAGVSGEGISEDSRASRPESKPIGADTGQRRFQDSAVVGSCLRTPRHP